jgi:hypothetical protein
MSAGCPLYPLPARGNESSREHFREQPLRILILRMRRSLPQGSLHFCVPSSPDYCQIDLKRPRRSFERATKTFLHPPPIEKIFFCDRAFVVLQIFREQILFDQHKDQRDFVCLEPAPGLTLGVRCFY